MFGVLLWYYLTPVHWIEDSWYIPADPEEDLVDPAAVIIDPGAVITLVDAGDLFLF